MTVLAGDRRTRARARLRDGALTSVALLLCFAAFDDITTGSETDFRVEYGVLLACAGWFLVVSVRLMRASRAWLGAVSFATLAAGLLAQREIGPGMGPELWPAIWITAGAWLWFAVIAGILVVSGWRALE